MSTFVLCQYIPSDQFKDLLVEFWHPILAESLIGKTEIIDLKSINKAVTSKAGEHISKIFALEWPKLIIDTANKRWSYRGNIRKKAVDYTVLNPNTILGNNGSNKKKDKDADKKDDQQ